MDWTGGDALAEALIRNDIRDLFLIPGIQLDWAVEALRKRADRIRLYVPRHEQTTTYMADGYYRASGRTGAAMVVPGPGALNAGAGLATAWACNSGVLFIAGQIHSRGIGAGCGLLHEIPDQSGYIRGLTKWSRLVESPDAIGSTVDAGCAEIHAGRPRPVGIEIPPDFLSAAVAGVDRPAPAAPAAPALPAATQLDEAARMIDAARLPVFYVGSGIFPSGASAALRALARKIGAPVVMSDNGRGALDDRDPLALTTLGGRAVFARADLVIVVGSRFADSHIPAPSWPAGGARFLHINIDPADLGPPRAPDLAIAADARAALEAIHERVRARQALDGAQLERVRAWAREQIDGVEPQAAYLRELRAALPEDGIFVHELTQVGYLSRVAFPVYHPRSYIGPGYQGTLGYGVPTALGAAVAYPGRRVLSITGDGGFGWNLQELATARKYELPVTIVVFNDGHFGNVRAIQQRQFGAEVAVELTNPDFLLLGRAFGVDTVRVDNPEAAGAAVRESMSARGPVLIEVRVGPMPSPWHLLRLQPMTGAAGPAAPPDPLDPPDG